MGGLSSKTAQDRESTFYKPNGVYKTCLWDEKVVKKLIQSKRLAPRFPPRDDEDVDCEECPICFMNYLAVNRTGCCNKPICSECFLQIRKPDAPGTLCPYCQRSKVTVYYQGPRSHEELVKEQMEQERIKGMEERVRAVVEKESEQERKRLEAALHTPLVIPEPTKPAPPSAAAAAAVASSGGRAAVQGQPVPEGTAAAAAASGEPVWAGPVVQGEPVAGMGSTWGSLLARLAMDPSMRRNASEIEQLMVLEAIRLSLAESVATAAATGETEPVPPPTARPSPAPLEDTGAGTALDQPLSA